MDKTKEAIDSFSKRAINYDNDGDWVTNENTISPMIAMPFGNKRLLDICSGTGSIANYAFKKNWNVVALDLTPKMLEMNRNDNILKIIGNLDKLPFLDNYFDLVTLRQGLHYSRNIENAIKECYRVSNSRINFGHITVFEENDINWWKEYFSIASPGRNLIFKPNEIYDICSELNNKKLEMITKVYKDSFIRPFTYLNKEEMDKVFKLLKQAPQNIKKNYQFTKINENDFSYLHRWEFISIIKE